MNTIVNDTLEKLDHLLRIGELPEVRGWSYMMHTLYERALKPNQHITPKRSSVVLMLIPKGEELHLLFIKRAEDGKVHSGQVAFPGGKREEEDRSDYDTALREMEEEVGVAADQVKLLGKLSPLYVPLSNFLIVPFVVVAENINNFSIDNEEVAMLFTVPLEALSLEDIVHDQVVSVYDNEEIIAPCWDLGEQKLWGATGMITAELIALLS